jgi:hypothetical protein
VERINKVHENLFNQEVIDNERAVTAMKERIVEKKESIPRTKTDWDNLL